MPITLAPDAAIDLQMHSTFSDGIWTADELLGHVAGEGFSLIAVTDHDHPSATGEMQRLAAERYPGVHALSAVEMSSRWNGKMLDLLCFGFDPAHNALTPIGDSTRQRQIDNIREAYDALRRMGYHFGDQDELVPRRGRPELQFDDLLDALLHNGYGDEMAQALDKSGFTWINVDPAEIVEAAHASGAVCLIAHPGRGDWWPLFDTAELDRLRKVAPVDGLEIYHPTHSSESSAEYIAYAERHNLLVSTGSDSHGKPSQWPIKYRAETSRKLLERLGVAVR